MLLCLAARAASAEGKEEGSHPLRCAVIATLTGGHAPIGHSIKNSIILASEEGFLNDKVIFSFEDDAFLPRNTVSIVNKLISGKEADCIILFGSTTSLAIAGLAENAKIPTIAIAVSPKMIAGRKYIFRSYISLESQASLLSRRADELGYRSVAAITTIQDATVSLREELFRRWSVEVTLNEQVNPEDLDLRSVAARIAASGSDAVFLNLLPPQIAALSRQLRVIGYKGDFFGGPPMGNIDEVAASAGALEGAWFVSVDDARAEEFYSRYRQRFGEHPAVEGIYGYDLANILAQRPKGQDLREYLSGLKKFSGLLGSYGMEGNSLDIPAGVWTVSGGKLAGPAITGRKDTH